MAYKIIGDGTQNSGRIYAFDKSYSGAESPESIKSLNPLTIGKCVFKSTCTDAE